MKHCLVMMFVMFLSGCMLPQTASNPAFPKATRGGVVIVDNERDFSQLQWWTRMNDPLLNHLMVIALSNNHQLQSASANILQAQAAVQAARLSWLPTLSAQASGFRGGGWDSSFTPTGALAQSRLLSNLGNIHFRGYYSGFVPSYSLNMLKTIYQNKWANASLDMQRAAYASTRLSVISQVAGTYFMLLGQREQLQTQSQWVRDLKALRQLEQVRFETGAGDSSMVATMDEQLSNSMAELVSIQNSIHQLENALSILLGQNPRSFITHALLRMPVLPGLIPSNIPSGVLKHRPDILMASANLKMAGAQVGVAYAAFFPQISLTGLLGQASMELSNLIDVSTGLWALKAAASMPLLNGAAYAEVSGTKAGYLAAQQAYLHTLKSAFAEVDNGLTNQQLMNQKVAYQLKAVRAAKQLVVLMLERHRVGAVSKRELLNAKIKFDNAQLKLVVTRMQQMDGLVSVYQSLACGVSSL